MNSGLSFSLAIIGFVVFLVTIATLIARALYRMDELEVERERRRAAARKLNLPDAQPPWCLRELDPNFVDWKERGWG